MPLDIYLYSLNLETFLWKQILEKEQTLTKIRRHEC